MKLKKIVSLALAGVMAVSMLAGCANNGGNGGNDSGKEPVTQPATGVAAAFNDAQSSTNKAKVVFSNDASLDAALAKAVKMNGQGADVDAVLDDICYSTGLVADLTSNYVTSGWQGNDFGDFINDEDDCKDGKTRTFAGVGVVSSKDAWSEDAAINLVASYLDEQIEQLKDTTYEEKVTPAGHTFYDFSYTGKASMVSVQNATGDYDYYFAIVVTQTCKADVRNG